MPPRDVQATDVREDDRVLFIGIPTAAVVRAFAARLSSGALVAIGTDDEVRLARREFRDLLNVMFVPAAPDENPWQDGYFTVVIDTRPDPAPEAGH